MAILNKLEAGKNCLRDFDGLMEKMAKITSKDLRNRFIVSGIKAIIAVTDHKNIYDVTPTPRSPGSLNDYAPRRTNCRRESGGS